MLLLRRRRLLWLHHLESVCTTRIWHHPKTGRVVMHSMSRMSIMTSRHKRGSMKDLLLAGMLMLMLMLLLAGMLMLMLLLRLRRVHPGLVAHKVHVNSRLLGGQASRGFAATIAAGMM